MNAHDLVTELLKRGHMLATAESCTGGMVAAAVTDIAGSSAVFDRGFVTYSNAAKMELLGVPRKTLETLGAVSEQTAIAMAEGALAKSAATIAVSITGIAGPSGGTDAKPVGLVHLAVALKRGKTKTDKKVFVGDRASIRAQARDHALLMVSQAITVG